ncbi:MAG: malectin domain-containing carbohydrate-binding protein [Bryobacteraceae bacterium]
MYRIGLAIIVEAENVYSCLAKLARSIAQASLSILLTVAIASAQSLSPSTPAKEYIRMNGRVVAVENAAPHTVNGGIAINAGGGAAGSFIADTDSGGGTYSTLNSISTAGVTNPAPQAVYQTERYGDFSYPVPNLTPGGTYTVRLHFAEIFWTQAGQRIFNVAINGATVLSNFDIIAAAGAADQAVVEQFTATADASGQITIQLTTVKDNAKLSGLEVQYAGK